MRRSMAVHRKVQKLRILVLGYIVRGPLGGLAWHHLQYVLGLHRMGHDVYFIEDSGDYPSCYDPTRGVTDADPSYGLRFAGEAFDRLGLGSRWAYHDTFTGRWQGPCARSSKAEFGVAKHGYVLTKNGWFSERSAAYMASGRPVVIQDTGFSRWLPVGMGVLPFNCVDEAVAAIESLRSRYHLHCAVAREIAADYFDAHLVLAQLIETVVSTHESRHPELGKLP